jgi:hypothetical protein
MSGDVIAMKDLQVPPAGAVMDYLFFNKRFLVISNSINGLAARQDEYDVVVDTLVQTGLDRINLVLGPFLTELQAASDLGFLIVEAWGGTPVQLSLNADIQFQVTSPGQQVFTPTPYLLALDELDSTNWGILSFTSWNPDNGQLVGHVIYATKTQNSDKWSISCNSALPAAMMDLLTQAQAAAATATSEASTIQALVTQVQQLIQIVQSGPVISVCGKTGAVSLVPADITGLVTTLNGYATTGALTTGLAGKQNSSALLTAFAALTSAADKLPYFTGVGAMTVATLTAFARTLLAVADAATARTTLGLGDVATHSASEFMLASASVPSSSIAPVFDDQTVTSYSMGSSDWGRVVTLTNASPITVTLSSTIAKGWNAIVYQGGAGQVTFVAGAGVTLHNRQGQTKTAGQYAMVSLMAVANAVVALGGDTA